MGSPFNQLQNLSFNLSGREVGIDKFKPYTFGNEKANLEIGYHASLMFSLRELSSSFDVGVPSGNLDKSLLEKGSLYYGTSGEIVGQSDGLVSNVIAQTGKVFGHPSAITDFSPDVSGNINKPLKEIQSFHQELSLGLLKSHPKETGQHFRAEMMTRGDIYGYDREIADLDFLFITGSYQSGDGPFVPPVLYPTTGDEFGAMDFLFVTGTYQGS
jgi:hypothetical protein